MGELRQACLSLCQCITRQGRMSDLNLRGVRSFIRSDKGPEFVAEAVQDWIATVGA